MDAEEKKYLGQKIQSCFISHHHKTDDPGITQVSLEIDPLALQSALWDLLYAIEKDRGLER